MVDGKHKLEKSKPYTQKLYRTYVSKPVMKFYWKSENDVRQICLTQELKGSFLKNKY